MKEKTTPRRKNDGEDNPKKAKLRRRQPKKEK
jgi:hypothetical protein